MSVDVNDLIAESRREAGELFDMLSQLEEGIDIVVEEIKEAYGRTY